MTFVLLLALLPAHIAQAVMITAESEVTSITNLAGEPPSLLGHGVELGSMLSWQLAYDPDAEPATISTDDNGGVLQVAWAFDAATLHGLSLDGEAALLSDAPLQPWLGVSELSFTDRISISDQLRLWITLPYIPDDEVPSSLPSAERLTISFGAPGLEIASAGHRLVATTTTWMAVPEPPLLLLAIGPTLVLARRLLRNVHRPDRQCNASG